MISCITFLAANLALQKPAFASSQFDSDTKASNAVDGNLRGTHAECALTRSADTEQWWYVDLQHKARIFYVKIKNRDDYGIRSHPFDVRVGDNRGIATTQNSYCVKQQSMLMRGTFKQFDCPCDMYGRYISFHTILHSYMDLCELEAYGYYV